MRMSQLFVQTLRETPRDAEVVSHQLLERAGYIRRLASGVYSYLPLMWRVLKKVSTIIREEMDAAGAQELMMPILQPAELWQESGRWDLYGPELMRLQDRHERDYALGPTHEELITSLARQGLKSYRQLPVNLYQIQNKYRDERRPRFGLLRGREFIMKDAYSFHANQADLEREYEVMAAAYHRIFERCGLKTTMVRSDSGAIGGSVSHEFMLLTGHQQGEQQSGENDIIFCDTCGYSANMDWAESGLSNTGTDGATVFAQYTSATEVDTPNATTIDALCEQLGCPPTLIAKTLLYVVNETDPVLVIIRGDLEVEETKFKKALPGVVTDCRLAEAAELAKHFNTSKGFLGLANLPLTVDAQGQLWVTGLKQPVRVLVDDSVLNLRHFVVASNTPPKHWVRFNWSDQQQQALQTAARPLRKARSGDSCPECGAALQQTRGIEVGNIFQLGTKYSQALQAVFMAEDGTEQPLIMGCYGIGVSRVAAAAVERYHDEWGMVWPPAIAPYHVVVVPANSNQPQQLEVAEQLYQQLKALGLDVVLDDRDERAGVKFKDADLIGFPVRVTVGKLVSDGLVEVKRRDQKEADTAAIGVVPSLVQDLLNKWDTLNWEPA